MKFIFNDQFITFYGFFENFNDKNFWGVCNGAGFSKVVAYQENLAINQSGF
jgi:hypothetical protein